MSNPTGDALHAAGLEDAAGVIKPVAAEVTDKPSALNATLEKMRRIGSWDVSFVPNPLLARRLNRRAHRRNGVQFVMLVSVNSEGSACSNDI